jgi:hypothetical protein
MDKLTTSTHPQYRALLPLWERCRDFYRGEDLVKEHAHSRGYLPMADGMAPWAYQQYIGRASCPGIFESTVNGRLGDIFRKPPLLEAPDDMIEWAKAVTKFSEPLEIFTQQLLREIMITGRAAIVLDFNNRKSSHELTLYRAEDILFWDDTPGAERVRLKEKSYKSSETKAEVAEEYLELWMEEGRLQASRAMLAEGKMFVDDVTPTRAGGALDFFPVVIVNSEGLRFECNDPPMLNLTNLLLAIFRNSADYEQGLHCLGVPTPVVSGIRSDDANKFHLGPYTPIVLEPPDAKAYYLEFNGVGITHLKDAIEEKLLQALMLGARLLQPRRQVESAEAAKTRMGAETSVLNTLVRVAEDAIASIFDFWLLWNGRQTDAIEYRYELNTDYVSEAFDPDVMKVINESELAGLMSPETAFKLRKRFELYPEDLTYEDERDLIDNAAPDFRPQKKEPVSPEITIPELSQGSGFEELNN